MLLVDHVGMLRAVGDCLVNARRPDHVTVTHPLGEVTFDTSTLTAKRWFYPRCEDNGMHEPPVSRALLDRLTPDTVFFDVGANVGYYTMLAASTGAGVHSFELDPSLASIVSSHPTGEHQSVEVVPVAVGARIGELVSFEPHQRHDPSTNRVQPEATGIRVPTLALDDYCSRTEVWPDVLKVDVEGFEAAVLEGAVETLGSVDALLLELHPEQLREYGATAGEVVATVREFGFSVRRFVDHRGEDGFVAVEPSREQSENCVLLCE